MRFVAFDPVIIKTWLFDTRLTDEGNAEVEVEIELDGEIQPSMQVELTLSPRNSPPRNGSRAGQSHGRDCASLDSREGPATLVDLGPRQTEPLHTRRQVAG